MIRRLWFYWQYAFYNLWRSRRWSMFAMLSIAAGVAAVVALRSLGLAIADSLTSNLRSINHGDISLEKADDPGGLNLGRSSTSDVFSDRQLAILNDWITARGGQFTTYTVRSLQVSAADQPGSLLNFVSAILIDPASYPPTQDIVALDPPGVPLGELFTGGHEVVISENLAQQQGIGVGDAVQISGSSVPFTVRGIVPAQSEASLRDILAAFFGFMYLDRAQAEALSIPPQPNKLSISLPAGLTDAEIQAAENDLVRLIDRHQMNAYTISVPRLLSQNQVIADLIGRLIVVMGLGAMLIGGVGIINTMLVLVRRRMVEIATLKTFGLRGRQIVLLFMTEALLLGVVGSLMGAVIGLGLSRLTYRYGEAFIQQPLVWRLYPEAALFGWVLGMVVTLVFGVIPVVTAVRVRPAAILRPNEMAIPAVGIAQSAGLMGFVVVALGLIAGQIIGPAPDFLGIGWLGPVQYPLGIALVALTLLILGLLVAVLSGVVWLVSWLPTFGWLDLSLALNNMRTRRMRTATTLVAIGAGMFAISSIAFYGAGARELLQVRLTDTFGGNVLVISPASFGVDVTMTRVAETTLTQTVAKLGEVVQSRTRIQNFSGQVAQVDNLDLRAVDAEVERSELVEQIEVAARAGDFETARAIGRQLRALETWVNITVRDSDNPNLREASVYRGRTLRPEDRGQRVAVILMEDRMEEWGVDVGSRITLRVQDVSVTVEVVGLVRDADIDNSVIGDINLPPDVLTTILPNVQLHMLQVEPEAVLAVLREISALPFFFPLDVTFIDGIVSRLIDQISALPLLVGVLSLGAAGVMMANTVALTVLERRRQIGIMKAIGLKRRRVIMILLLENGIVSLMGALLGLGLTAAGSGFLAWIGEEEALLLPADARPVALGLIGAALLIGALATLVNVDAAARERVLHVLRYE